MKILLLGSGGREHAIAFKLQQSTLCKALYIAPGNAGTKECGTNVDLNLKDFDAIKEFCLTQDINMIVVGPEEPLVLGIFNYFAYDEATKHIIVIGPSKEGAQLEGSKAYSKHFMQRHKIPTANYAEFTAENFADGIAYIQNHA